MPYLCNTLCSTSEIIIDLIFSLQEPSFLFYYISLISVAGGTVRSSPEKKKKRSLVLLHECSSYFCHA